MNALRGLTLRGRCLLATGIVCCLVAPILGERDVLRLGVLLATLPFIAALVVGRTRYKLVGRRDIAPDRVAVGAPTDVVLTLRNEARSPTGTLLLEDLVPSALGTSPRGVVTPVQPGRVRELRYQVRAEVRGRYRIGPLIVRVVDPFGLCTLSRRLPIDGELIVTPPITPLAPARLIGGWGGDGEGDARSLAIAGEDDVAVREYHQGDDLRRVHWPMTAHSGTLMVRREEQPWRRRAVVVLDNRAASHAGEGPASSFEWAVAAAASIALRLLQDGYTVELITDDKPAVTGAIADRTTENVILDQLATVRTRHREQLYIPADAGLVVAVLGQVRARDVGPLAAVARTNTRCAAVYLDTPTWVGSRPPDNIDAVLDLVQAGWRLVRVRHGDSVAERWASLLATGSRSAAWR